MKSRRYEKVNFSLAKFSFESKTSFNKRFEIEKLVSAKQGICGGGSSNYFTLLDAPRSLSILILN